ncbi:MAG: iron-containing alcohol dehydrogenase [Faecousia sp.]
MGIACNFLKTADPVIANEPGAIAQLPGLLAIDGVSNVLIVTDPGIVSYGLSDRLTNALTQNHITYTVYSGIHPNPTVVDVESGRKVYREQSCQAVIALGGGSSLDSGKLIAAMQTVPQMSVPEARGNFKISSAKEGNAPPVYAVPTTAGTGSEVTIVSVVTDSATHEKYTINDSILLPRAVILDPNLTETLPPAVTAAAGMDALTHAVESYIGKFYGTKRTWAQAAEAVQLIFANLERAYQDGSDMEARANMLTASYIAGCSFGRAGVGYCHAIAHAIGGISNMPHGELNAVILPELLRAYGTSVTKKLSRLAEAIGIHSGTDAENAEAFIRAVEGLRDRMHMPGALPPLTDSQKDTVCARAMAEGNPTYPVPKLMSVRECRGFLDQLTEWSTIYD